MTNLAEQILSASKTSFVDATFESEEALRPKLLYNNTHKGNTVLAHIEQELRNCDSFWFSVAFITRSGLIVIKDILKELEQKHPQVKGRILTTNYLSFNEPEALKDLLNFSNLEVRIVTEENFHTKGYMFAEGEKKTFIVGSSNLTQNALKSNKEWNLKVTSLEQGELILETHLEFENMWERANVLTEQWITDEYEPLYREQRKVRKANKVERIRSYTLQPNFMQREATKALNNLRTMGEKKALLVSATGTGKTYLSAFDARNFAPKKMLFLVHREQILKQAEDSFKDVLGNGINTGLLTGNHQDREADYLFSTVQTMSKDETLRSFARDYFDYIIIDETHKAGADSYQKIIDYFNPKFMLGMTASPERTDGYDIYKLFDNNIAYEIRLQKAMEEDLLCPFHYFGISDIEVDGVSIDEASDFNYLVCSERVNHIIEKAEFYGYSGNRVKGLVFCSSKKEAKQLSDEFNLRGYDTIALSGEDSQEKREDAIRRLEQDGLDNKLDYIFTVDIFNEGVDIPQVNQVIMARRTESPIVFVQQLGRGLRKAPDKEYVVVLDFIGNYQNNFMIPIALSGDRSYNKDTIRKYVREGSRVIPGCSTIHFDEVAKKKIFASIDKMSTTKKMLTDKYMQLKFKLGRIPTILDFYEYGEIDPMLFIDYAKTYDRFVKMVDKDYQLTFSSEEEATLEFISASIVSGKRPHELLMLKMLAENKVITCDTFKKELNAVGEAYREEDYRSAVRVLSKEFMNTQSEKKKFSNIEFLDGHSIVKKQIDRAGSYFSKLQKINFASEMRNLIEYGLKKYSDTYHNHDEDNLVLYEKYSRKDVCRILNWEKDDSSTMYGYRIKHGTCPIFVTYKKKDDIASSTKYEDQFVNPGLFSWMTRSKVKMDSEESQKLIHYLENGLKIYLFVKKSDGEGSDFYYMGRVTPEKWQQTTIENDKGQELPIMNFLMRLENSVREDLYDYIVG